MRHTLAALIAGIVLLAAPIGPAEASRGTVRTRNIVVTDVDFPTERKAVITVESQRKRIRDIACWAISDDPFAVGVRWFFPGQTRKIRFSLKGQEDRCIRFRCNVLPRN